MSTSDSSSAPSIVVESRAETSSVEDAAPLSPPRRRFVEGGLSTPTDEDGPQRPRSKPSRGELRSQQRNMSSFSRLSGASTPRGPPGVNPFATPTGEASNPFSPPASVVSFSLEAENNSGASYPFPDRARASVQSSTHSSAIDLRQRPLSGREAFDAPPSRPNIFTQSTALSTRGAARRARPASTMIDPDKPILKPWASSKDTRSRVSYFITYAMILVGVGVGVLRCYTGWTGVKLLGNVCLIMDEQFTTGELDSSIWAHEVDLGGFGNGEFEMTTASPNNTFIKNNQLYLFPTLTSDVIGADAVLNGHTYNLTGCTNSNLTACGVVSNSTAGTVINPVMSSRLTTKGKKSIQYGRVEVRAKLPTGDWLWPAIWMLPENNTYGPWPISGEIDIMEARGNDASYPDQGSNYVRGSLNWGPLTWINEVAKTYGWWTQRRQSYADGFHTYALEWSPDFLRIYVDTRLTHMLELKFDVPFFERGDFPASVSNGSQEIILPNPWVGRGNSAPFDRPFYLILDLAVGGTNGWFPDGAGNKPWLNGANTAMADFAHAQDQWYSTWPQSEDDRALRIDSVKMWESC